MSKPHADILALPALYLDRFFEAEAQAIAKASEKDGEEEGSYMLQVVENVGLINIRGMMTNVDRYYNRFYGLVSYNEIRAAAIEAMESGAESLLFSIDSPGGRVGGMGDLANFISSIPIPTISYTDSMMASAAYFWGLQSDLVYADSFAEVGSVGVISVISDWTKAMEKEGVKFTRLRSGDLKQAGDGRFPLSEKERKYLQSKIDLYAEKFFTIVSEGRGIPRPMLDSLGVTDGGTYIGEEAVAVGLVDAVASFDQVLLKAMDLAKKSIDKKLNLSSNSSNQFRI